MDRIFDGFWKQKKGWSVPGGPPPVTAVLGPTGETQRGQNHNLSRLHDPKGSADYYCTLSCACTDLAEAFVGNISGPSRILARNVVERIKAETLRVASRRVAAQSPVLQKKHFKSFARELLYCIP